jgi:hypothetical protein
LHLIRVHLSSLGVGLLAKLGLDRQVSPPSEALSFVS